ncbi:glycosyltransferase family 2 protein [Candidatus Uhrbacteria bacterium]|nr:glycosyltransferase family 2 protein [Candidatus Uhrbacteria bacterium]
MKVIAVMPAYEEASRIEAAILDVKRFIADIVVVDDGSQDQTADVARRTGAIVLRHVINRGQGAALKTGTQAALKLGADVIVHIDADGQHDGEFLPRLIESITNDQADVVLGSRFLGVKSEGMPWSRRVLHVGIHLFNTLVLGISFRFTDPQSGLRAMKREVAESLEFFQDRYAHCSEILRLLSRSTFRVTEVPTKIRYTSDSLAKGQKASNALKIVWQLLMGSFQK